MSNMRSVVFPGPPNVMALRSSMAMPSHPSTPAFPYPTLASVMTLKANWAEDAFTEVKTAGGRLYWTSTHSPDSCVNQPPCQRTPFPGSPGACDSKVQDVPWSRLSRVVMLSCQPPSMSQCARNASSVGDERLDKSVSSTTHPSASGEYAPERLPWNHAPPGSPSLNTLKASMSQPVRRVVSLVEPKQNLSWYHASADLRCPSNGNSCIVHPWPSSPTHAVVREVGSGTMPTAKFPVTWSG